MTRWLPMMAGCGVFDDEVRCADLQDAFGDRIGVYPLPGSGYCHQFRWSARGQYVLIFHDHRFRDITVCDRRGIALFEHVPEADLRQRIPELAEQLESIRSNSCPPDYVRPPR